MVTSIHKRQYETLHHYRNPTHDSKGIISTMISMIPTVLLLGFIWGIGYLFFLMLIHEIS